MGRVENLVEVLPSWLDYGEINDIVVVDWSSPTPIRDNSGLRRLMEDNPYLKVVRVRGEKTFSLAKSYNLAVKFTDPGNKMFLKLDSDHQSIDRGWLDRLDIRKGALKNFFVTGVETRAVKCLCGVMLINKKDFLGYNENFSGWGYDDIDLYRRVAENIDQKTFGGTPKHVAPLLKVKHYIYHMPHKDSSRVENYDIKDREKSQAYNEGQAGSYWPPQVFRIIERESQYVGLEFLETPFPK